MSAILRRLVRLVHRFVPRIRECRSRRLEASGEPYGELLPLLSRDYDGPALGIAETIRLARDWRLASRIGSEA